MATASAPATVRPRKKASRVWWCIHQWVGFKLSLLLAFICLTGSLAVLSNEMDWLLQPSLRVAPSSVAGDPDWDRVVAGAAAYPGVKRIQTVTAPEASAFAARATVVWHDDRLGFLNIHPTTGAVQGIGPWVGAQRIFRNLHRHLNMPGKYGIPLVTSLSFLLLVSLGTSFIVYKKWWRGFFKPLRKRNARTWWGDFHRLTGVWSLWFVALIALTSLWYFVEVMGAYAPPPQVEEVAPFEGGMASLGEHFPASHAAARRADPELRITSIRFPTEKSGAFVFGGDKSAILVRPRANTVWTEARSDKVLATFDGRDMTIHQRISEMADPLHFGNFGGYWTKIPWFLFGLAMTSLCVSGVAIYALRIGRELKQAVAARPAWRVAWAGMGLWGWAAAIAVIVGFVEMRQLFSQTAD